MMELELFPSRAAGPFGRRLKHARGGRIPVTVLTGFLGAGKTTLLRQFPGDAGRPRHRRHRQRIRRGRHRRRADPRLHRPDHAARQRLRLLRHPHRPAECAAHARDRSRSRQDSAVRAHRHRDQRHGRPGADPADLRHRPRARRRILHRGGGRRWSMPRPASSTIGWSSESRKQVILADRLILSKADLATQDADDGLRARLRELNPHAEITVANEGHIDPNFLIEGTGAGERSTFVAEAEHSDGIASFVVTEKLPLSWTAFARDDGDAGRDARLGSAAGQRLPRRRGLPRAGAGAIRAAPRPSAGGTRGLAGRRARQPRRFHHPEHLGSAGARVARRSAARSKRKPDRRRSIAPSRLFRAARPPDFCSQSRSLGLPST